MGVTSTVKYQPFLVVSRYDTLCSITLLRDSSNVP